MTGEVERLNALRQLNLLDTPPSESFDRITRMASQLFSLPIAAVSLTDADRQWFKSRVGVDHWSIPREKAPCAQVADTSAPLVICDMLSDPIYRDSLLARSGIRFYAGSPLITAQGHSLGSMCVLGTEARETSPAELAVLGDLAAMVMAQIELQHAFGRIDPVSGLPNRTQFIEDLDDVARDGVVGERRYAVLVDIAGAEQLSEAVRVMGPGHFDELVLEVAHKIITRLGPTRKAYHVATSQIAFLALPGTEEQSYLPALDVAIDELASTTSSRFLTTATIGVASFNLGQTAPSDVLRRTHSAAQDARKLGTKVSLYSPRADEGHRRRFRLIADFGSALEASDQLRLVYQPRLDIASGACVGVEALLRWRHPTLGDVSPGEFIPMIECTSLARSTTAWVIETALRQAAEWQALGVDLRVSVNVSAANLEEADFLDMLRDSLDRHCVPASSLELEVTESAMMSDSGKALTLLAGIAAVGVTLAIDDFGTGYSSLAYLQQLPAQVVKIDQSFMRNLAGDERRQALIGTMALLSHNFDYRVVAEGVETDETLMLVAAAGFDEAQGYLFARPMEPDDFLVWLGRHSPFAAKQLAVRAFNAREGISATMSSANPRLVRR